MRPALFATALDLLTIAGALLVLLLWATGHAVSGGLAILVGLLLGLRYPREEKRTAEPLVMLELGHGRGPVRRETNPLARGE